MNLVCNGLTQKQPPLVEWFSLGVTAATVVPEWGRGACS